MPVLVRVNGGAKSGDGMSFYGFGGIAIDILDASDISPCQLAATAPAGTPCTSTRAHFIVQGSEVGAEVGGGVEMKKIIVEVRAEFGLREVFVNTTESGKTRSISLLFGYRLRTNAVRAAGSSHVEASSPGVGRHPGPGMTPQFFSVSRAPRGTPEATSPSVLLA